MSGGPRAEAGGQRDEREVERASATPRSAEPRSSRKRALAEDRSSAKGGSAPGPEPAAALSLAQSQAWFLEAIRHPESVHAGVRAAARAWGAPAAAMLTASADLSATERLGVYHHAYRARLIEALADDYPTVLYTLGRPAFDSMAAKVIAAHPSRGPNLNAYGKVLLHWLDGRAARVAHRGFLRELAELEWALVEAVHAAPPPKLDLAQLQAVPPAQWGELRFVASPSLRVLSTQWPVNPFLQAVREGKTPAIPTRRASFVAVYREGFTVWRMDLSALVHGLLTRLVEGQPLGEALTPVEGQAGSDQVMRWFEAWVRGGVFSAIGTPERS